MRPIYVVDTNILVDYVEIIPNGYSYQPEKPTVDLSHAHIVIPTAVIRELSQFKSEKSDRGKAAREALRRIRHLVENDVHTIGDSYHLEAPISVTVSDQLISVLPVHQDFSKCLPFRPADTDMDGQIILATLVVGFIQKKMSIDGTASSESVAAYSNKDITLLTNDNGLAIRARERGIKTQRYGYKYPEPYTGRREVIVPKRLFWEFFDYGDIDLATWEEYMPKQPPLIANEFIVMKLEDELDYPSDFDPKHNPYFSHIGRYDEYSNKITRLRHIQDFPICLKNAGQAIYAEALMDPNISAVVCTGPAGSGKTYMATVYGYQACKNGDFIGVTVVPCDSKSKLGALPGDLDEKMDPEVQPIKNALRNYLLNEEQKFHKELGNLKKYGPNDRPRYSKEDSSEKRSIKARLKDRVDMIWDNWFSNIPIENARGRDFSHELAIYDEFQDQSVSQADTLIKRLGADGKIIITGDIEQIHAPYIDQSSSGLVYASKQLKDSPMVAQVHFTEDEVIRHPLVRMIAKRQKDDKSNF
ncbi:PhoH family protein [Candidatus Saccharibacteria bacterium]|nr:PhoH family protein [Candidatus Saccharibacteria bacterium]